MKQDNQFTTGDTSFLLSKHTREIYSSLRRFSEMDVIQSIYARSVPEHEGCYSVFVFLSDYHKQDVMDAIFDYEAYIHRLYPDNLFIYSYLEDDPRRVFANDESPIMIFNRGESENG